MRIEVDEGKFQTQFVEQGRPQLDVGHVLLHARWREVAQVELDGPQLHRLLGLWGLLALLRFLVVDEVAQKVLQRLGQLVHHLEDAELDVALARVVLVDLEGKELDAQFVGHQLHHLGQRQGLLNRDAQQGRRDRGVEQPHLAGHGLEQVDELLDKRHAWTDVGQFELRQGDQHRRFVRIHRTYEGLYQPIHALRQDL